MLTYHDLKPGQVYRDNRRVLARHRTPAATDDLRLLREAIQTYPGCLFNRLLTDLRTWAGLIEANYSVPMRGNICNDRDQRARASSVAGALRRLCPVDA